MATLKLTAHDTVFAESERAVIDLLAAAEKELERLPWWSTEALRAVVTTCREGVAIGVQSMRAGKPAS